MAENSKIKVMIAGIGGASLGTEIAKCLRLAGNYQVFGCDVSPTAFGLFSDHFADTRKVDRDRYVESVVDACQDFGARWLVPGGEAPMVLLGAASQTLAAADIRLVSNSSDIIKIFSDKAETFKRLTDLGIEIPRTAAGESDASIESVGFPCIVKPATKSGGSSFVFLALNLAEAKIYVHFLRSNGHIPLLQEYIDDHDGEFTVGVLSLTDASVVGSVALRRSFDAKLSVAYRGSAGLISSGYSQGFIGDFPEIRSVAEKIAKAIGSRGPINVQGRIRNGCFVPFEINPRFSASTYLRALAGFNEVDLYLKSLVTGERPTAPSIRSGWYLRSLTEAYVAAEAAR